MSEGDAQFDVVIPARGEGARIEPCLRALLEDGAGLCLRVIVVLNGEAVDETAAAATAFAAPFAAAGHELVVARSETGKARALNAGDALRRGCAVAYLDADVVAAPGMLRRLSEALADESAPTLACPRARVTEGRSVANRAFVRVWSQLPIVRDGVIGGGCYAVNAAGRRLWDAFPEISGDDAFVCALFPPERRIALSPAAIHIRLPEHWEHLVAVRARWLRSAREGSAAALAVRATREGGLPKPYPAHAGASRWSTLLAPRLFSSVPVYVAVDLAARVWGCLRRGQTGPDWRPLRR